MWLELTSSQQDTYPSQCGMVHLRGTAGDALYVQFTDIRDAVDACANMRKCHWQVSFLRPRILGFEASDNAGPTGPLYAVNNYEGQLKVQVLFNPQNHDLTAGYVIPLIKATLAMLGDVKAIHSIPSGFPHVKEYCVEYFNVRDAARAVGQLNNHNIGVSFLTVMPLLFAKLFPA